MVKGGNGCSRVCLRVCKDVREGVLWVAWRGDLRAVSRSLGRQGLSDEGSDESGLPGDG